MSRSTSRTTTRRQVDVINSTLHGRSGLTATATVYDVPDLRERFTFSVPNVEAPANAAETVFRVPPVSGGSRTYFLRLQLRDAAGRSVSDNLYWYSTQPDVLSGHHSWFRTPVNRYADMRGLGRLPTNADVAATARRRSDGEWETVRVTITNESQTDIAFFVRAAITAGPGGSEVLPIRYSRNDISLFPGESTRYRAVPAHQSGRCGPKVGAAWLQRARADAPCWLVVGRVGGSPSTGWRRTTRNPCVHGRARR